MIPFKLSRKIALVTSLSRFKSIEKHNTESKMKKRIFRLRPEVEEGAGLRADKKCSLLTYICFSYTIIAQKRFLLGSQSIEFFELLEKRATATWVFL